MRATLHPCDGCSRHIRVHETSCPFCGVAIRASPRLAARGRAALMIVAAGSLVTLAGCDMPLVGTAHADDETEEPVRQTPQYGAPSGWDDPPPPPPPPLEPEVDAGRRLVDPNRRHHTGSR